MNKKIIILEFFLLTQSIINGGNSLKNAKEAVSIICNRNLIESLVPKPDPFNPDETHMTTVLMKKHCPYIFFNCCSDTEFTYLKEEIETSFKKH